MNCKFDNLESCENCSISETCKFKDYLDEEVNAIKGLPESNILEGVINVEAIIKVGCKYRKPICGGESK